MKENSYLFKFFLKIILIISFIQLTYAKIKVSIIIPTYNSEEFIDRSVQAALNQTLKDIEVIVINDCSTDNTKEVLKKYEKDPRMKIINLEKNRGPGVARNTGINYAKGKFVGFIDSDDYVDPRYYEKLYSLSKKKDVVRGIFVDSTNDSDQYKHHRKFKNYGGVFDSIWKKSFINKHDIRFSESKMGEDIVFRKKFYKYKPREAIAPDEGIYYYYKRRTGSLMNFDESFINQMNEEIINSNNSKNNNKHSIIQSWKIY